MDDDWTLEFLLLMTLITITIAVYVVGARGYSVLVNAGSPLGFYPRSSFFNPGVRVLWRMQPRGPRVGIWVCLLALITDSH